MKLNFLFREYNLDFVYDLQIRPNPIYPIKLSLNDITIGHQLSQLFFSIRPMHAYPSNAADAKDWRDYKVKKL